ncbi:MAG TPA: hypothetical protein VK893_10445 [Pyrinomonadaceae bacterium]|nr:hypothetical protein [Pyrinomonadaceae bacterium]
MAKKLLIALAAIMGLSILAFAANKPNFSGTWTMDRARSFGMPGDMTQVLTITQTDDKIEVETKIIQPNNERTVKDTFFLDGKEHEFTPPTPANAPAGQTPPKGKRTTTWLPGDAGLTVTDVTTAETPEGAATTQNVRKWTINTQGELVIDSYFDSPRGSFEAKRIFKKQ